MKLFKIVLLSLLISTPLYASDEKQAVSHVLKGVSQLKSIKTAKKMVEERIAKKLKISKEIAPYIGFTYTAISGELTTEHFNNLSYTTDNFSIEFDGRYNIHDSHYSIGCKPQL